jgi:hypothetical protein
MPDTLEPAVETRDVYADFVFSEPQQALDFAATIGDDDGAVVVDFSVERSRWRANVQRRIHPVHQEVAVWLATLTSRATQAGGDYDDWGKSRR